MSRLDLVRLRKSAGMSQRELAERLKVRQSFLSAIENGRSRLPEEKLDKIKRIFNLDNLDSYMTKEAETDITVPPHSHPVSEGDAIAGLLKHIHDEAHRMSGTGETQTLSRISELEERNDFLSRRNDQLSDRLDKLREQIDSLREENFKLKELLTKNSIGY